ncbi:MAG TPA: glycerate kinase [bacterium]|nr:glycerate kinase [bacterium]
MKPPLRIDDALFQVPETAALRRAAVQILARALREVDAYTVTSRAIRLERDALLVDGRRFPLPSGGRVIVVGAGKACAPMARAVEDILGDRVTAGLVTVKTGYTAPLRLITLREASHPLPDAAGEAAARETLALLSGLGPGDLVICLISGGGSALLPLPREGLTLRDKVDTTDLLLRSGADITEINTVRKHLSRIKGGQLARAAAPARLVAVVVSDIVGSPLDAIASGPTVPDGTTFADALAVLEKYRLTARVPPPVLATLRRGAAGGLAETPKAGDAAFTHTFTTVVADNAAAARAAAAEAERLGFRVLLLSTYIEGEAREVGRALGGIAREIAATGHPVARPACIVCGGETTVTVTGAGRGGRNQEVALGAARPLAGLPGALLASFATDGTDGPTDAAGGVADGTTLARARARGLDAARHLADNNAYPLLEAVGDLIRTGPTNTNVNDLMLILCGEGAEPTGPDRPA